MARILAANLLFLLVGLGPLGLAGEVWLRQSYPFVSRQSPMRFVPGVGVMLEPDEEVRWTDMREYWTISRTNRLGFLDRGPISRQRAASSCHITLIGDSFVDAREVDLPEKAQVRLEALAARERPDLDITTSAFAIRGIGTVQQIPLYDTFARPRRPKVVVLVAAPNDYEANTATLWEVMAGAQFAEMYARVSRDADGVLRLRLPDPSSSAVRDWIGVSRRRRKGLRAQLRARSFLWVRLESRIARFHRPRRIHRSQRRRWRLARDAPSLRGWRLPPPRVAETARIIAGMRRMGMTLPPAFEEALEGTALALDEFGARAVRDGFRLLLLLNQGFRTRGDSDLRALAEERGIPVIDLHRHITGVGGDLETASFHPDPHWTPTGHRWAAEAIWDYLKARPSLCEPVNRGAAD